MKNSLNAPGKRTLRDIHEVESFSHFFGLYLIKLCFNLIACDAPIYGGYSTKGTACLDLSIVSILGEFKLGLKLAQDVDFGSAGWSECYTRLTFTEKEKAAPMNGCGSRCRLFFHFHAEQGDNTLHPAVCNLLDGSDIEVPSSSL